MIKTVLDFLTVQKTAIDLIQQEKYSEAISYLEEAKKEFPSKIDRIGHWLAGIYCIQNDQEKALSELSEVLNKGSYWNPSLLASDSDLALIHATDRFAEIIQSCEELYETHKNNSRSLHFTIGNHSSDTSITALHWKGSNAWDFSEQIAADELKKRFSISFIQSSQLFSHGCYHWDDYNAAKKDIVKSQNEVDAGVETSFRNKIILGASQGADTAINMYLEPETKYDTVIALVPTMANLSLIEERFKDQGKQTGKLIIITGDHDPFYQNVLKAQPVFEKCSIPHKLIVIEGMGHTLPDNLEELIIENI
ncbi:tetratricopeptide repeat protein [Bacillus salacetis]|uniref:Tetratricopeptide repeat protein n=1 Tax=Bacillus salacetis TaxID=2315464 RepID=A0A3A1QVN1_9BACI|nr:tetratricopeptide repeat protein [Bacillus salacetis]RIW32042.1 tetratricopeptide repeat protein [Bacillus salacetis]